MTPTARQAAALIAAFFLAALLAGAAVAQEGEDARALAEYRLTDAGLEKFTQATRNLGKAMQADPGLGDRMEQKSVDDATIAQTADIYDSEPAVREAIEDADLTSEEYITFMYSVVQAGMGAWMMQQYGEEQLPPGTPRENIDFYVANADKIEALSREVQAMGEQQEQRED